MATNDGQQQTNLGLDNTQGLNQGQQDLQNQQNGNDGNQDDGKTYTKAELEALLKEAETKGFVKGKTDTTAKLEKKFAEQARLNKEETEKQMRALEADTKKHLEDLKKSEEKCLELSDGTKVKIPEE